VEEESDDFPNRYAFLDYSAEAWGGHFHEAGTVIDQGAISLAVTICDLQSKSYSIWFPIFWSHID
jgi:hypothetical protein